MPDVPARRRTKVLVAGVSTRAAAESARRAEYDVVALDAFGDLDQHPDVRALSLPRDFGVPFSTSAAARVARGIDGDAVAYLSSFENHPRAVGALAAARALWGNTPAVLRRVRDPEALARVLGAHGAAVTMCGEEASHPSHRWLLKPRASGGGHGVRFRHAGDRVPRGHYLQEYIDGTPGSIVFAAAAGRAVPFGLSRQLVGEAAFGATGFRYCGNILAAARDAQFEHDADLLRAASELARLVAREFDLVGVNGIDFVARGGVPYAIEVNPRWSASMELAEEAYLVSVFGMHATACTTRELPAFDLARARTDARATGKAIVFARHDIVCGDTRPWLDDPTVRDVPHPGESIQAGRPVCTVFAIAPDSAACHAALVRRAGEVYAELEAWASVAA